MRPSPGADLATRLAGKRKTPWSPALRTISTATATICAPVHGARTMRLKGRDPFPSRPAVQRRQHLHPTTTPQTPRSSPGAPTAPPSPPRLTPMAGQFPTTPPPPRPMPVGASPSSKPSRLSSTLTGTLWGAVCGALLGALAYVTLTPGIAQDAIPSYS
jgi:hypothetical protein